MLQKVMSRDSDLFPTWTSTTVSREQFKTGLIYGVPNIKVRIMAVFNTYLFVRIIP